MIAAARRGVVHHSQLDEMGIHRGAVAHRLAAGSLHRVFASMYAVGHPALAPWAVETAALLCCGDDCLLSHATAAAVWHLVPHPPPEVSVTAIGRHPRSRKRLQVHRVVDLDARADGGAEPAGAGAGHGPGASDG